MKAIGIVGSPRKAGNTELMTAYTLKAIAEEGLETELIRLADLRIEPCNACNVCRSGRDCPIEDDFLQVYDKMLRADAIILSSPVYFGSATALLKGLMERGGMLARTNDAFTGKVGGALVVARRAGKNFTFAQINFWFSILGMIVPGSTYWNVAVGREKGEINHDTEGMTTARNFGKNVAFLVKKLKS
jgi:multimeric flavodoxin WrbA